MQKYRILIVDDDPDLCHLIELSFRAKYDIVSVQKPNQVFEILDDLEPDLFIIDIMLPDTSGFNIAKKIKDSPKFKYTPIVFLTAKGDKESIKKGYGLGAIDYQVKPISIERFEKNINVILERNPPPQYKKRKNFEDVKKQFRFTRPSVEPIISKSIKTEKKEEIKDTTSTDNHNKSHISSFRMMIITAHADIKEYLQDVLKDTREYIYFSPYKFDITTLDICQPDIIILSPIGMGEAGLKIARDIKLHSVYANIPIIFLDLGEVTFSPKEVYAANVNLYVTTNLPGDRFIKNVELFFPYPATDLYKKRHTIAQAKNAIRINEQRKEEKIQEALDEEKELSKIVHSKPPIETIKITPISSLVRGILDEVSDGKTNEEKPVVKQSIPLTPVPDEDTIEKKPTVKPLEPSTPKVKREPSITPFPSAVSQQKIEVSKTPLSSSPKEEEKEEEEPPESISTFRIFIVDNKPEKSKKYYDALYNEGYELINLKNCLEVIKLVPDYQPDLIISELFPPKMEAIQMCNALRKKSLLAASPIILFSKEASDKNREKALSAGALDFISKNTDVGEFLTMVNDILHYVLKFPKDKKITFDKVHSQISSRKLAIELELKKPILQEEKSSEEQQVPNSDLPWVG